MLEIIKSDEALKKTYDLIRTVVGVGPITSIDTIVYTNNFQNFDTPRQYASFIGVAPFDHTSSTSVNGRTRYPSSATNSRRSPLRWRPDPPSSTTPG